MFLALDWIIQKLHIFFLFVVCFGWSFFTVGWRRLQNPWGLFCLNWAWHSDRFSDFFISFVKFIKPCTWNLSWYKILVFHDFRFRRLVIVIHYSRFYIWFSFMFLDFFSLLWNISRCFRHWIWRVLSFSIHGRIIFFNWSLLVVPFVDFYWALWRLFIRLMNNVLNYRPLFSLLGIIIWRLYAFIFWFSKCFWEWSFAKTVKIGVEHQFLRFLYAYTLKVALIFYWLSYWYPFNWSLAAIVVSFL